MSVITISRQYGSGGTTIAAQLCEALNYRYLDKVLMTQVAAEVGISGHELARLTEEQLRFKNFLERLFLPGRHSLVRAELRPKDAQQVEALNTMLDDTRCANLVREALLAAYDQGDVVIVGRGGQAVLQKLPAAFHVRIEAPMPDRILRIQGQEKVDAETALEMAQRHDRLSAQYLKRLYNVQWDDVTLYHIVVNTGKWELEVATRMILGAYREWQAASAQPS